MKSFGLGSYAIRGGVALALLAGCGGSQPPIGALPQTQMLNSLARTSAPPIVGRLRQRGDDVENTATATAYKKSAPLLFVTDPVGLYNEVDVYDAQGKEPKLLAHITKDLVDPAGDCVDRDGTLYVANEPVDGPGWISEYALGQTKPLRIITKGINTPAFCAIDASGNLWVTNIGLDDVAEYLKGSTKPHARITKGLTYPDGIAIDHSGDLYVGNLLPDSAPNVQVFASGSKSPSRTITDGISWPVGLGIDHNGTLYVANLEQNNVEEYLSGQDQPYQTITEGLHLPSGLVLNGKGWLYVANTEDHYSGVVEFPPSSLMPSKREISFYFPLGVAYYPPLLP